MILNEIQEKLHEVEEKVFYGAVSNEMRETLWNYTVFNRVSILPSQNRTGYTEVFAVHIVREEFIPEGVVESVINALLTIPGMKFDNKGCTYDYTNKPSTNNVVEMCSFEVIKARKVV